MDISIRLTTKELENLLMGLDIGMIHSNNPQLYVHLDKMTKKLRLIQTLNSIK